MRRTKNCRARGLFPAWPMMRGRPRVFALGLGLVLALCGAVGDKAALADPPENSLRVQAEVSRGPYRVGQGFDLRIGAIGKGKLPRIDPPVIRGARAWVIGTDSRPISSTSIGMNVVERFQHMTTLRVLPAHAGVVEIPAITVKLDGRSSRTQPIRLTIQSVPVQGRPAEFLGGVGRFNLEAAVSPGVVRIGQKFEYRVKVAGPAAWGMTARPDLARLERSQPGLRIAPKPDELDNEPPVRTFVYEIRPMRAGELVLPPVSIASFDPSIGRYVTHVTSSVSVRVVDVPSFDPIAIADDSLAAGNPRFDIVIGSLIAVALGLAAAYLSLVYVRRRRNRADESSPWRARRYARESARAARFPETATEGAGWFLERLGIFLNLGLGRPMGALTPAEAQEAVERLTGSGSLGKQAEKLTTRCDAVLYGDSSREADADVRALDRDARRLFKALGRIRYPN